jgi:hypothetical protein
MPGKCSNSLELQGFLGQSSIGITSDVYVHLQPDSEVESMKKVQILKGLPTVLGQQSRWLRGVDLNHRPLGYEPNELPDCSTPHLDHKQCP